MEKEPAKSGPLESCAPSNHPSLRWTDVPPIVGGMDLTALQKKIEHYRALEGDVIARQAVATTNKQRFEFERMRRIITVLVFSLLATARNQSGGVRELEEGRAAYQEFGGER
jgi:hypothetical protein